MGRFWKISLLAAVWVGIWASLSVAREPKHGGVLRVAHRDSPGSPSILEESSDSVTAPFMSIFNNLVLFKQDEPRNTAEHIEPELASSWSWSADKTALTFVLRQGVKWHDGKPFTSADVKCTWDYILGRSATALRNNPRGGWYHNLKEVVPEGDFQVRFQLGRPQPAMLSLLAAGYSAIYPCHVPLAEMRRHPIGTGPFKFVEFRTNEFIKLTKNTAYWRENRPYLEGIEWTIIPNRSTSVLAFVTGKVDMTFPNEMTPALMKDIKSQAPESVCRLQANNCAVNVIVNRERPPFDNPDIRRALALALDRQSFIDILTEGHGLVGGAMQPAPEGSWGMPREMQASLPGYSGTVEANRAEARKLMEKHGYGPDNRLKLTVNARNVPTHRDPGVLLTETLRNIYIDAELVPIDTAAWFPKITRKDYTIGPNITCGAVDDPDQNFYENYGCGSARNFTQYCNKELQPLFNRQSMETDVEARKKLVWEIDRRLQEDLARPILYHNKVATCWKPAVHGIVPMVNSVYNFPRFENVWMEPH